MILRVGTCQFDGGLSQQPACEPDQARDDRCGLSGPGCGGGPGRAGCPRRAGPVRTGRHPRTDKGGCPPPHRDPIATWITPRNSRKVQMLGTSTRRHTSGLIPSSPTLTCTISATSASAADDAVSTTGLVRFGARVTRSAYRRSPLPVAGTPDILMLTYLARIERLSILLHLGLGWYQAEAPLTALVQNSKPALTGTHLGILQ